DAYHHDSFTAAARSSLRPPPAGRSRRAEPPSPVQHRNNSVRSSTSQPPVAFLAHDHLRIALFSRSVIDQAIGIVLAQRRGDPDTAFAILRTISQRRNVKLRTVAAELVDATRSAPADDPP